MAGVRTTDLIHGPFIIVVTDPAHPEDQDYPMVVGPTGGWPDKVSAERWLEPLAQRRVPYCGLQFVITQLTSLAGFVAFVSWED